MVNSHVIHTYSVERATSVGLRLHKTPHPNWVDLVVLFGHQPVVECGVRAPLTCKDPVGDGAEPHAGSY
jgi:hypothetical protein